MGLGRVFGGFGNSSGWCGKRLCSLVRLDHPLVVILSALFRKPFTHVTKTGPCYFPRRGQTSRGWLPSLPPSSLPCERLITLPNAEAQNIEPEEAAAGRPSPFSLVHPPQRCPVGLWVPPRSTLTKTRPGRADRRLERNFLQLPCA